MYEIVKLIDENLEYLRHEIAEEIYNIYVISSRKEVRCPYCGSVSSRVHSHYEKRFQDLPIQGKKVIVILNNRKMFCDNKCCTYKTYAESFGSLAIKSRKTKRLIEEIITISLSQSSVSAARYLQESVVDIKKSSICNYLKKNNKRSK